MRIENGCVAAVRPPEAAAAVRQTGGATFADAVRGLLASERQVDGWLDRAMAGGISDPAEMLRLQVTVGRFQLQVELAARLVDQASQAVRTLTRPT